MKVYLWRNRIMANSLAFEASNPSSILGFFIPSLFSELIRLEKGEVPTMILWRSGERACLTRRKSWVQSPAESCGPLAQVGEHRANNAKVMGSNPIWTNGYLKSWYRI